MDLTLGADALLLGRVTYEGMAQAWPQMGGNPFADHVNAMDKYVVASEPVDTAPGTPRPSSPAPTCCRVGSSRRPTAPTS